MTAPEDINVDELRRRARRRLVGAIVLALVVAVFVPMLLESDPKPLGEDVAVKIPPVDEGKFVNRLGEQGKSEKPPAAKAEGRPEAAKTLPADVRTEVAKAEPPKADGGKAEPARIETTKAEPKAEPKAESKGEATKSEAKSEPGKPEAGKSEPARAEAASAARATETKVASPAPGDFAVQVFAFSDDKGANSLVNKLKKAGYPAYTEPLTTSRGTLWRVRVGPYPSRESAVSAREKLKGEGYNGIVAAAK